MTPEAAKKAIRALGMRKILDKVRAEVRGRHDDYAKGWRHGVNVVEHYVLFKEVEEGP